MKVTLLLPPTDVRNCECFQLPNVSIPILTGYLRSHGVTVDQQDFDVRYHAQTRHDHKHLDFSLLGNRRLILDYLHRRLPGPETAKIAAIEDALFGICPLQKSDLFGISLVDFKTDFLLNSAALLANKLRRTFKAPVVIGNRTLPRSLFEEILAAYPVFDYAVYTNRSEEALLQLVERIRRGGTQPLAGVVERRASGQTLTHPDFQDISCRMCPPDYRGYPIAQYALDGAAILSRYNCQAPVFRKLLQAHGARRQQLVISRFETSCRGKCIFCEAPSVAAKSNCRKLEDVLDELRLLKGLGVTGIYFINSQFNNRYEFADALCSGMIREDLTFQWCDCVNFRELDEKLLDKMRASGAVKLTFGMETGSARLLRYIRKGADTDKISRLLRHSHSLGIWNHIELIGGLPTETPRDLAETKEFIQAHADCIDIYSLNPFFLYAGSPLHLHPERHGIRLRQSAGQKHDYFDWDENIGIFSEEFDEIGGLSWEEKDKQISASTESLMRTIEETAPPVGIDYIHINLLMYFYAIFGHQDKALIRKLMKISTARFKPYNLDSFMRPPSYQKHKFRRVLKELPT